MDFFTVPTATFRILFVLVILDHDAAFIDLPVEIVVRAEVPDNGGEFEKINDMLILSEGSPTEGVAYEYIDENCPSGDCFYKLEDIDIDGVSTFHRPIEVERTPGLCGTMSNAPGVSIFSLLVFPTVMVLWLARRLRSRKSAV